MLVKSQKSSNFYPYLLFFIWPFIGVLTSLKARKENWAKNILWLFVVFYGYNFVIPNEGSDANAYVDKFVRFANSDLNFDNFSDYLYNTETNNVDILEPLMSFVLSGFTDNPKFLFAFYGLVFGFFYSRNIFTVLKHLNSKFSLQKILVFTLFAFSIGIWEINGFRFWAAAHIFFYGVYPYITERNKSKLIFAFLSVFMHFSFILMLAIFVLYVVFGNRTKVYFILFLVSFFISELNNSLVSGYMTSVLPDIFSTKVEAYTSDAYIDVVKNKQDSISTYNLIVKYSGLVLRFLIVFLAYINIKLIKNNSYLISLFSFTVLFFAISNIISLIPSGGRFLVVVSLFLYGFLFIYIQNIRTNKFINILLYLYTPIMLIMIIYNLRVIAIDTFSIYTFISNPLLITFLE